MKKYQIITKLIVAGIGTNDEGIIIKEETAPIFKWAIGKPITDLINHLEKEKILIQYTDLTTKVAVTSKEALHPEPLPVANIAKDKKAIICPECDGLGGTEEATKCPECLGTGIVSKPIPIVEEAEPVEDEEIHEDN